jgi:hypothetical protein
MQVPLALLADHANVSAEGKLNLMGAFDVINARRFPAVHAQMHLVFRIRSLATLTCRLRMSGTRSIFSIA